jgi:hypothetical protein
VAQISQTGESDDMAGRQLASYGKSSDLRLTQIARYLRVTIPSAPLGTSAALDAPYPSTPISSAALGIREPVSS